MTVVYKTVNFPDAILGVPYEAAIGLTAAAAVTAIAVSTGALPPGITVSSTTDPRLVGTPTTTLNPSWTDASSFQPNVFTFTITANDGAAVVSSSYTITVLGTEGDLEHQGVVATPAAALAQLKLA